MRRRQLIAHLRAHGCVLVREGARHSWWGNPNNNRDVLAQKICRDLGISRLP